MTKLEYKVICLIIDKHTGLRCGQYQDYHEIDEEGIKAIKQEIKDVFEVEE